MLKFTFLNDELFPSMLKLTFCLRPTAKLSAEGLGITFWPHPCTPRTLLKSATKRPHITHLMFNDKWQWYLWHVWHISQVWHTWHVSHCDTLWHAGTKSNKMPKKAKIWQFGNLTDVTHRNSIWHFDTSVTQKDVQFIRPWNDGRRHGRGTYLFLL
jgi:hypothetical protein